MKNKILIVFLSLPLMVSCATGTFQKKFQKITLQDMEMLPLGSPSKNAKELFGSPWKRMLSMDDGRKTETWIYLELIEGYEIPRLTINFDFETQRLENKLFHIYEGDAERKLENIKTRYRATFNVVELPWCGHTAPSEDRYIDEALGLTVSFSKNRQEVNRISWSQPSPRIISSIRDQCPKVTSDYKEL